MTTHTISIPARRERATAAQAKPRAKASKTPLLDRGFGQETEAQFQTWVCDLAGACGFRRMHVYAQGAKLAGPERGFPDWVFAGNGRVIYAELKRRGGRCSAEQVAWHDALRMAGADVFIWTPADRSAIERIFTQARMASGATMPALARA